MTANPPKKSDLGVRVLSAIVMVAVAGTALWLGGWAWAIFVLAVGLGVLWEWWGLVRSFVRSVLGKVLWLLLGVGYVGTAGTTLATLRFGGFAESQIILIAVVAAVIGTDIGAYFVGRTIGGPKIAPSISPSKTWSGLVGGMLGAGLGLIFSSLPWGGFGPPLVILAIGAVVAIVAQAGDFLESWMKRRAGVKDSGHLIPGHGGLFDRVDGLLAVSFGLASLQALDRLTGL